MDIQAALLNGVAVAFESLSSSSIFIAAFSFFLLACLLRFILKNGSSPRYVLRGPLFTPAERSFYGVLVQAASSQYLVFGKVRISDILLPERTLSKSVWHTAFNKISKKHFDFVLCDKDTLSVLAAIELDDSSHTLPESIARDSFVESACSSAGLPLVRFDARANYQIQLIRDKIADSLNSSRVSEAIIPRFNSNRSSVRFKSSR
jgi:hypothetical protein